ncbi:MAG: DUF368 domain-containing protein [Treponema sp.]|nr:DUF368 domain-containing protein [Treponema sp.]
MDLIILFIKGIAIGMVNIIPGVSGGTLAVILGIYDKFVNAITFNVKKLWQNKRFVIPLILGLLLGVLIFSKLIDILYTKFPFQTNFFFTGLILGSLPMLYKMMVKRYAEEEKLSVKEIISIVICALAGLALIIVFTIMEGKFDSSALEMSMPPVTLALEIRIFIAGILGAVAMIIPGISGSLIMLMMGVYTIVVTCIPALFSPETFLHALILLLPNGVGVLIGLLAGAKLISFLLKKFPNATYAVIFGLIVGSLYVVFPGFSGFKGALSIFVSIICLLAGFFLAFFSSFFESRLDKEDKEDNKKVEE